MGKWNGLHADSNSPYRGMSFDEMADSKRKKRMAAIDNLPSEIRELVHVYGWTVVNAFLLLKVTEARHIRHLVETVLNEFSPTRGSYSSQGIRTEVTTHPAAAKLDERP